MFKISKKAFNHLAVAVVLILGMASAVGGAASASQRDGHSSGRHDVGASQTVVVQGLLSGLPGAVITVTPQHGTPSTFTVNTSTIVRERDMSTPVLANGERVIVSAATSAPGAVATAIRIIPAPKGM